MNRVRAIREDAIVGIGSCSSIDECLTNIEVRDLLDEDNITTSYEAVKWARDRELFYLENAMNYRRGGDDPQLSDYHSFEKLIKENPISLITKL